MSRIGRIPILIPQGVKVSVADHEVVVSGPKGTLKVPVHSGITVEVDAQASAVRVKRAGEDREQRALHGLTRSLIANMTVGVTQGYTRKLQVVGVGYSAKLEGQTLVLQVGFAHPVKIPIPAGLQVPPPTQMTIAVPGVGPTPGFEVVVSGADKQLVGEFAAGLRRVRPPEPYKGKGIRYVEETVRIKPGKAFVSGA